MKDKDKIIKLAITAFLTLTTSTLSTSVNALAEQDMEKCYGITKAGMNDCATATASCAGSATKDSQADAFIFLPKGTCDKIVGGHLKSKDK
jgi:uncharacterized membrane protein